MNGDGGNKLNENELAFYARYECDRKDYDKSKEYFNKIQKPEHLKSAALAQYAITSLNLGALEDFSTLKNRVYINTILLNRRINENQDLINNNKISFEDYGIEIDKSILDEMIDRINDEAGYEISMLSKRLIKRRIYKISQFLYNNDKNCEIFLLRLRDASILLYIAPEQSAITSSSQRTSFPSAASVIFVSGSCSRRYFRYL